MITLVTYICRDCLSRFDNAPDIHEGDQYCEPCKRAIAEQAAIGCVRQLNLEEMGFTPDEVEADIADWRTNR